MNGIFHVKKENNTRTTLLNNRLVKTKAFNNYIDVGNPVKSSKIYSDADADELVFLNIERK